MYNKYGNVKVVVNGRKFDSKHEAKRYSELLLLQRAGKIRDLKCQVVFELIPPQYDMLQLVHLGMGESADKPFDNGLGAFAGTWVDDPETDRALDDQRPIHCRRVCPRSRPCRDATVATGRR